MTLDMKEYARWRKYLPPHEIRNGRLVRLDCWPISQPTTVNKILSSRLRVCDMYSIRDIKKELEEEIANKYPSRVDGLYVSYKLSWAYAAGALHTRLNELYGISVAVDSKEIRFWFTKLPDTNITIEHKDPMTIGYDYVTDLFKKLVATYYTPYVDEILGIQALRVLPLPIADAITDCMEAVIERRYEYEVPHYMDICPWGSETAFLQEIDIELRDDVHDTSVLFRPFNQSWELCAAEVRAIGAKQNIQFGF